MDEKANKVDEIQSQNILKINTVNTAKLLYDYIDRRQLLDWNKHNLRTD
jgi:hypothetical protein